VVSNGGAVVAFGSEAANLPGGSGAPPPGISLIDARGPLGVAAVTDVAVGTPGGPLR
jgi:hypothetical protein